MRDKPETRYAWVGDHVAIAYQVVGDGPVDVVYLQGYASTRGRQLVNAVMDAARS